MIILFNNIAVFTVFTNPKHLNDQMKAVCIANVFRNMKALYRCIYMRLQCVSHRNKLLHLKGVTFTCKACRELLGRCVGLHSANQLSAWAETWLARDPRWLRASEGKCTSQTHSWFS